MAEIIAYGSKHNHQFKLKVEETGSPNIAQNKSYVKVTATLWLDHWSWSGFGNDISFNVSVNGNDFNGTIPNYTAGQTLTLVNGAIVEIPHNSDGTKEIGFSITITDTSGQSYTCGDANNWGTMVLTTIPRTSTISCTTANIEETATIVINRASNSFTHTITYAFGDLSGTIATKTSNTTIAWTIPSTFYAKIPNSKTGTGTLTCKTFSGNTEIGTSTTTLNVTTSETRCKPTLSATVIDTNSTTIALTGSNSKLIRYKSTAKVTISATARNSSSITSKKVNNITVAGTELSIQNVEATTFNVVATDSRGYTSSVTLSPTVIPYVQLSLNAIVKRTQPTTGAVDISFSGNYYNGSFGSASNSLTITWFYRVRGASSWTTGGTLNKTISNNKYSGSSSLGSSYDYTKQYEFLIRAEDSLTTIQSVILVPQGKPTFNWGKDFVNVYEKLQINEINIFDIIFPVGSTYITQTNTNPNTIIGVGTWERVKGRVLVGLDENDSAFNSIGKTGGEKTHTLTIDEIPSHSHDTNVGAILNTSSTSWGLTSGAPSVTDNNTRTSDSKGGGQAHNNLQPYRVVGYMWIRTS